MNPKGNQKHLTFEQRVDIEKGLTENKSFKEIAKIIGKDPSTVSKEVRLHAHAKERPDSKYTNSPCVNRKNCKIVCLCDERCGTLCKICKKRKLHDMTLRLDGLYDVIVELEEKIEDVKLRRKAVEQDAITLENIYTLLANFEKVYDKISDEERKSLISSLIKEIEIFPCDESELPLKSILFNFPVYKNGGDVYEFLWDKSTHVSTCGVRGNISTGYASFAVYLWSKRYFRSRASVDGLQETITIRFGFILTR